MKFIKELKACYFSRDKEIDEVSFGDGVYTVYKITHNRKVIGLQLQFN